LTLEKRWQAKQTNATPTVQKAFAYITREQQGKLELLVFQHWNPKAGIQIPKGSIEANETAQEAALREAHEETGLDQLELVEHLASDTVYYPYDETTTDVQERHLFHLHVLAQARA